MNKQRVVCFVLIASGLFSAILAIPFPAFWLGYLFWFGWMSIAFGKNGINKRWFWILSSLWNLAVLWFLLEVTDYRIGMDSLSGAYSVFHLILASVASVAYSIIGNKNNSNKALEAIGTSSAGPDHLSSAFAENR